MALLEETCVGLAWLVSPAVARQSLYLVLAVWYPTALSMECLGEHLYRWVPGAFSQELEQRVSV